MQCFHIFLRPCSNYIIFFLHLLLSVQSPSISPFSPIIPLIPSAQVNLDLPRFLLPDGRHFSTFFWYSPLLHFLDMSVPLKLFGFNVFLKRSCHVHFLFNNVVSNFVLPKIKYCCEQLFMQFNLLYLETLRLPQVKKC